MKKLYSISFCLLFTFTFVTASAQGKYNYQLDLTKSLNDKLDVVLKTPKLTNATIIFRFPAMVPGTYKVYDFGRFVSNFKAMDSLGNSLPIKLLDINSWEIENVKSLYKITYSVEDTWDTTSDDNYVFEPAGTNFESDKNFYLNTHSLFGYFEGFKNLPYVITIARPSHFYGATALTINKRENNTDVFTANSYMDLVDSPMMYCKPDTTSLKVGNATVLISVYSTQNKKRSTFLAKNIEAILNAQKDYLGGKLPIDKYAFVLYLFTGNTRTGSYGALEHSYSSFYYMPDELSDAELAKDVRDIAAHEFFHIVVPLTIHSTEIGDFDYNQPKMSKHLWLYEGVTEYFAHHVQLLSGLIKMDDYLKVVRDEIISKSIYNDTLPFTVMSKNVLQPKYENQYDNVYQKGALIGLCLDIKLNELSNGNYNLRKLLADLSLKYGKNKSFNDDDLINDIVQLSHPDIRHFFANYIEGNQPLPLSEILDSIGVSYKEMGTVFGISPLGGIIPAFDPSSNKLYIHTNSYIHINDFGKQIGFNVGDVLLKLNHKKLKVRNFQKVLTNYFNKAKAGDDLELLVLRKDDRGKNRRVKLKVKIQPTQYEEPNQIIENKNATPNQLKLRNAWLK